MTGHDQFREGIKSAVMGGCFSRDFETHPVGTAKRLEELESEVKRLRRLQRKGSHVMRSARGATDDLATPAYPKEP